MKTILICAGYKWPFYAPAFSTALQNLGVQVFSFPFDGYLNRRTAGLELRLGFGPSIARLNHRLKIRVQEVMPDVCLIWTGLAVWPSTIKAIARYTKVTSYTNDDPFGSRGKALFWRNFKKAIPVYHCHHVYRDANVEEYRACGAKNVGILRSYYVPWLHFPEGGGGPYDRCVTFIGHGEPYRLEAINYLGNHGIPVRVYGPEKTWRALPENKNVALFPGTVDPDRYRQLISRSGVCVGFLSRVNRDDYTRRYFEIPACGGVLLAERTSMAQGFYHEGEEVEFFHSDQELLDKCARLLDNPAVREKIRVGGLKRCSESGYDVYSRARNWLADIEKFLA